MMKHTERCRSTKMREYIRLSDELCVLRSILGWIYTVIVFALIFSVVFNVVYNIVPADIITKKGSDNAGVLVHIAGYQPNKEDIVMICENGRNFCAEVTHTGGEGIGYDLSMGNRTFCFEDGKVMTENEISAFFGEKLEVPKDFILIRIRLENGSYAFRAVRKENIVGGASYAVYPFKYMGLSPIV